MVISLMAVGQKITTALMNSIISGVNQTALAGIVPTSVAGTGVTVSPNGVVTFTNATSVSLNGVFSGSFDNYRITWNSPTRSANSSTTLRLRAAGTDLSSATYDWVRGVDSGTARVVSSSSSSTGAPIDSGVAVGQTSNGVLDIFGPALSTFTTGTAQSAVLASSAASSVQASFANESAAPYDGFTLTPTTVSSTWSGTMRVYGYNNLT